MKISSWLQIPLVLVLGFICSMPFQNFAQDGSAHAEGISRSIASVTKGVETSCRVTLSHCPKFPEIAGVKTETEKDADQIPLRCLDRAKHYATICQASEPVRAEFFRKGVVLNDTEVSAVTK